MNIYTYSPALALLFAWVLLWILMGIQYRTLTRTQKWLVPLLAILFSVFNHMLRQYLGSPLYSKLILLTLHLPTFLVFLQITKCGIIKMAFMILSALVFATPTIIINNITRWVLFVDSSSALLLSNLLGYGLTLLFAYLVFRRGFNYLLRYGDNRFFLRFSLIPLLFYIYAYAILNLDLSSLASASGYIVRYLPCMEVFVFYFLLLDSYRQLSQTRELETTQAALSQELDSAEEQIHLLNKAQTQTAIYQHDMRHHLVVIDGLLSVGHYQQAAEYIGKVRADLDSITPKRFCENEIVNLLCSSFSDKAARMDAQLTAKIKLPQNLSISDTALCSLLSNGLENALHAVREPGVSQKWVELYCGIKQNKLLIEVKNPYVGEVVLQDGLPVSTRAGHGYGCRSIHAIATQHRGFCTFEANQQLFTLRIIIPLT